MAHAAFLVIAAVAVAAALGVVVRKNPIHGALFLVVNLAAVAALYLTLRAELLAAAQVIIYAGAIVVLFVFVVMMLGIGRDATLARGNALDARGWIGPAILAAVLAAELAYVLTLADVGEVAGARAVEAQEVGIRLFGPYLLAVELASLLLLAALVGAYHVGRRLKED